ncbi:hypothetical protein [Planococcus chinensis]|uniref:hypothetical protein n=1 Tax=Planococcus chinensis TaxID=272917 RepID=UPI001CC63CFC|nr:hypothetical protein [Planococcus chinensis]
MNFTSSSDAAASKVAVAASKQAFAASNMPHAASKHKLCTSIFVLPQVNRQFRFSLAKSRHPKSFGF